MIKIIDISVQNVRWRYTIIVQEQKVDCRYDLESSIRNVATAE